MTLDIIQHELQIKHVILSNDYKSVDERFIDRLSRQISRGSINNPILIDEKLELIAGIRRILAAEKIGKPIVTALMIHGANDVMRAELIRQDKLLEGNGEWTIPKVRQVLEAFAFDLDPSADGGIEIGDIVGMSKLWKKKR